MSLLLTCSYIFIFLKFVPNYVSEISCLFTFTATISGPFLSHSSSPIKYNYDSVDHSNEGPPHLHNFLLNGCSPYNDLLDAFACVYLDSMQPRGFR